MEKSKVSFVQASDFAELEVPQALALSPDGKRLAFVLQRCLFEQNKYVAHLHLLDRASGKVRQWTFGEFKDRAPVWSADGKRLAFLRYAEGRDGIYILSVDGGEPERVLEVKGFIGNIHWAEGDGAILAKFLKANDDREGNQDTAAGAPAVRKITGLAYQMDGLGFLPRARWQLFSLNLQSGEFAALTREKADVGVWAVAPDGLSVAYTANVHREPDTHSMHTQIFVQTLRTGRRRKLETPFGEQLALAFSPNGKYLAYLGHHNPEDAWSVEPVHPHLIDLKTGKLRDLTPNYDRMAGDVTIGDTGFGLAAPRIDWSADSKHLFYQATDRGDTVLVRAGLRPRDPEPIWKRHGVVSSFAIAGKTLVISHASQSVLGDFHLCDDASAGAPIFRKAEPFNRGYLRSRKFGEVREAKFKSGDGTPLQGWLALPPDFKPRRKYPAILEIHGGPRMQYGRVFFHEMHYLAAQGFVVFYTNPRGSQGYGRKFAEATVAAWGTVDYEDILAAADYLEAQHFVDARRIGIAGGSYGGFMTAFAIGHTNRFRAAVMMRGATNWTTVQSTGDVGWHLRNEFGGYFWENPDYYVRVSPVTYAAKMRTPLLIMSNEADMRCPPEQAQQLYVTLKLLGRTPVELWRFPEEGHGLSRGGRPDRRVIRLEGIAEWFRKWMK